jgi:hypothetical protein
MNLLALALLAIAPVFAVDLTIVRAEPDLEKRSEKALVAAEEAFQATRKAFKEGDTAVETAGLATVREAVELAVNSLENSGKDARRNPKYFKKAEIALRKLIRNLDDYRFAKPADERAPVEAVIAVTHDAHDKVLTGIMTKKPKAANR